MKKLKVIIALTIFITSFVNAQCEDKKVVNFTGSGHYGETGFYYKDLDSVLDNFVGHYRYDNGNTSFDVVLQKKEGSAIPTFEYCEDMIIGGYKYIKNGELVSDLLDNVDQDHVYGGFHVISGNLIYPGSEVDSIDCKPKEIVLAIRDINRGSFGDMNVRKIIHNEQEALRVYIFSEIRVRRPDQPPLSPTMFPETGEEMILIKQE